MHGGRERIVNEYEQARVRLAAAIEAIAESRLEGAVLRLEADWEDVKRRRVDGNPAADESWLLAGAARIAGQRLGHPVAARNGYIDFEFILECGREDACALARDVVQAITADPLCGQVRWVAVLIRIFPGEPERTFCCDPGYGLASVRGPAVVWVDPYPHADWWEPQRYPTVTRVWPEAPR